MNAIPASHARVRGDTVDLHAGEVRIDVGIVVVAAGSGDRRLGDDGAGTAVQFGHAMRRGVRDRPNVTQKVDGQTMGIGATRWIGSEQRAGGRKLRYRRVIVVGSPHVVQKIQRHRRGDAPRSPVKRTRVVIEVGFVPACGIREVAAQIRFASIDARDDAIRSRTIDRLDSKRIDVDAPSSTGRTRYEDVLSAGRERVRISADGHRCFEGHGFVRIKPIDLAVLMRADPNFPASIDGNASRPRVHGANRDRRQNAFVVLSEKLGGIIRVDDAVVVDVFGGIDHAVVVAIDAVLQIARKLRQSALFTKRSVHDPHVTARIHGHASRTISDTREVTIYLRSLRSCRLAVDRNKRCIEPPRLLARIRIDAHDPAIPIVGGPNNRRL